MRRLMIENARRRLAAVTRSRVGCQRIAMMSPAAKQATAARSGTLRSRRSSTAGGSFIQKLAAPTDGMGSATCKDRDWGLRNRDYTSSIVVSLSCLKEIWLTKFEDRDGFEVGRLGKQVKEVEGSEVVDGLKSGQVAGKRGGIAGDVDERGRGDAAEEGAGFETGASAGWIEDDEIGAVAVEVGAVKEVERGGLDGEAAGTEFG